MRRHLLSLAFVPFACGTDPSTSSDGTSVSATDPTQTSSETEDPTTAGPTTAGETGSETEGATATDSETDPATTEAETTDTDTDATDTTDTGELSCDEGGPCPPVVVMGYWPPTNEMLRQWSQNPEQNPDGWQGKNWNGLGYDVYAFFPEFPPDGDPSNDDIGTPGSVGSEESDLQVDYQDTSADFWRIVDEYQPVVLLTTSRGGMIGWEVEAIEGGHFNPDDPNLEPPYDWISDGYGDETHPTMETIDPRSWDAISTYRQGNVLNTQLPAQAIVDAVEQLGLVSVAIDQDGTSGRYLSGFLGLHGLYYNLLNPEHNLAAGHIHVGFYVTTEDAIDMVEETLTVILETVSAP